MSSKSGISWNGDIVDMGTFENVVNVRAEKKFILIGLGGYFHLTDIAEELGISQVNFEIDINIDQDGLNQVNHSISTGTATISGNTSRTSPDSAPIEYRFNGYQTTIMHRLSVWNTPSITWGPMSANQSQVKINQIRSSVDTVSSVIKKQLESCIFVPAIRGFDKRFYHIPGDGDASLTAEGLTKQAETIADNISGKRADSAKNHSADKSNIFRCGNRSKPK